MIEQRYGEEHAKGPPRDAEDSGGIGGAVAGLGDGGRQEKKSGVEQKDRVQYRKDNKNLMPSDSPDSTVR